VREECNIEKGGGGGQSLGPGGKENRSYGRAMCRQIH
jgi:hypothetical protein